MNKKNIVDGFVPRRSRASSYKAPLTGAPAELKSSPKSNLRKRQLKKQSKNSSTEPWQDKVLLNSVLSGAKPSDPVNAQKSDLSSEELPSKKKFGRGKNKNAGPRTHRQKIKRALKFLLIPLFLLGGFYIWNFINLSGKIFGGNPLGFLKSTKLRGEDAGRVNILLAGTSEGDPNHPGEQLTDSIMVISYDTVNKKTVIVSIPRDLWVKSSVASTKINALYFYGEQEEFSEPNFYQGGIGLLQKEVEKITGLDIHYYAKINYNAFKESVDAVGGIEVDIQGSDPRGIYDPNFDGQYGKNALKLKNGVQTLNGTQALLLARARNANGGYGLAGSDYDRTENQRKMLIALKNKALGVGIFTNPLKINQLSSAIGDNVDTDFKTEEVRRIYDLAGDPTATIESVGLTSENVLKNYTSPGTGAALIPKEGIGIYTGIQKFLKEKMAPPPSQEQGVTSSTETADVVVLNAGGISGSAQETADNLPSSITTLMVGNSNERVTGTKIVALDPNKKNAKTTLIQKLTATEHSNPTQNYSRVYPNADFVILVGKS